MLRENIFISTLEHTTSHLVISKIEITRGAVHSNVASSFGVRG